MKLSEFQMKNKNHYLVARLFFVSSYPSFLILLLFLIFYTLANHVNCAMRTP